MAPSGHTLNLLGIKDFGGKGGVGKTTVAAAIGWALANRHPDQNIRIILIDPAHSLGDAQSLTDKTISPRA
jgi:anion-transporting  ArsA/GET3 family ATPase